MYDNAEMVRGVGSNLNVVDRARGGGGRRMNSRYIVTVIPIIFCHVFWKRQEALSRHLTVVLT